MANIDAARGFIPVGSLVGGQYYPRSYPCADGQTIYKGDVVSLGGEGEIEIGVAGDAQKVIGVAAETITSATSEDLLVYDDPNIIYEVQGYTGVTFVESQIGELADHVATAGDSTYLVSRQEINDTSGIRPAWEIGGTAQFMILGKVNRPGNAWGEHVKLLVKFYEHQFISKETS